LADPELIRRLSRNAKIQILVTEAQEFQLALSEMAELADNLASDPADKAAITEAAVNQLIALKVPAGRVADLRKAFGTVPPASPATPAPGAQITPSGRTAQPAVPMTPAAAKQFAKGSASQQTKEVQPPFKVPFENQGAAQPTPPPKKPAPKKKQPASRQPTEHVAEKSAPKPSKPPKEVMDTGAFQADWADLTKEVQKAATPEPPKVPKAPLPLRGKAAQILSQGAAAAPPPPPRSPTTARPRPRSSAEPVMRRDTMQFGSARTLGPADEETAAKPAILLADDDARIRMVFRIKLQEKGFKVVEAPNGAEAWKLLQKGGINAAVLDMKMPGLHGLEVLQRLADSGQDLPVVICTAYDRLDDEFVVATYPKLRYLTKPVDADQLAGTLLNLLAES
jgi:CheY-like chemotaxis protein